MIHLNVFKNHLNILIPYRDIMAAWNKDIGPNTHALLRPNLYPPQRLEVHYDQNPVEELLTATDPDSASTGKHRSYVHQRSVLIRPIHNSKGASIGPICKFNFNRICYKQEKSPFVSQCLTPFNPCCLRPVTTPLGKVCSAPLSHFLLISVFAKISYIFWCNEEYNSYIMSTIPQLKNGYAIRFRVPGMLWPNVAIIRGIFNKYQMLEAWIFLLLVSQYYNLVNFFGRQCLHKSQFGWTKSGFPIRLYKFVRWSSDLTFFIEQTTSSACCHCKWRLHSCLRRLSQWSISVVLWAIRHHHK